MRIRKAPRAQLSIIFMSASADDATTARPLRSGAIEFLEKPIAEQVLFAAITSSLILFHSPRSRT